VSETARTGPEAMRQVVRDYVWTVHATYLDHVRHLPPGERAALPLVAAGEVTVVAAAARRLHLLAVTDALPAPAGPEVEVVDEHLGLRWVLRFFDPSVLPALGLLADDTPEEVRRVLGVSGTLYHLSVEAGGGLDEHHARHTGVALANEHARTIRAVDRLRAAFPRRVSTVDELGVCVRLGLTRAAGLLGADLTDGRVRADPDRSPGDVLDAVLADVTGR
jgi:hypothetical protein